MAASYNLVSYQPTSHREPRMKAINARTIALSAMLAAAFSLDVSAGEPKKPAQPATPVITDWSQHHLIFSQPRTPEQAARVQKDVRYQQQMARHTPHPEATLRTGQEESKLSRLRFWRRHHRRYARMHRDWSMDLGSNATVGAGKYPAKYAFSSTSASCISVLPLIPDYVVFPTSISGTGISSIVAYTNLYAGCGGPQVPGVFWAYDTGGQVTTSPIISFDGTQVAFTQTSGGVSSLVLLKWAPFTGIVQTPVPLTSVPAATYASCPALTVPCMTVFSLGSLDTDSSVYYDYGSDIAWVGDDSGKLHEFTGLFKGTPAEATAPWPVAVGTALSSPVHDDLSGNTFVGDSSGFLYRVDGSGNPTASGQLDVGTGLTDGPVIDSTAGSVYVASSNDGAQAALFQLSTTFASGSIGTEVSLGVKTAGTPVYHGAFDHTYETAPTPTGNFYVCGNPGDVPTLYQVPVTAGVMGTPLAGPIASTTTEAECSPVTDVYNATVTGAGLPQEWVFLSTKGPGFPSACNGVSCIMNFKVTAWQPGFQYNLGQEVLDSNLNIEVCENSGNTSGATHPTWGTNVYDQTDDNGVHWRNQGPLLSTPPNTPWAANTGYNGAAEIIDSNNNIQIAQPPGGTSSGSAPTWATGEGDTTADNDITWINLGKNPVAGLHANGGTSGIIMDNTVVNPGGSQVYFSHLQNASCFTSGGTGGCAIQASQQDLN